MVDRKQIVKNTVSFIKSEGNLEHKNRVQKLYWEYRKKALLLKKLGIRQQNNSSWFFHPLC